MKLLKIFKTKDGSAFLQVFSPPLCPNRKQIESFEFCSTFISLSFMYFFVPHLGMVFKFGTKIKGI